MNTKTATPETPATTTDIENLKQLFVGLSPADFSEVAKARSIFQRKQDSVFAAERCRELTTEFISTLAQVKILLDCYPDLVRESQQSFNFRSVTDLCDALNSTFHN